jgi:hypothetical protein
VSADASLLAGALLSGALALCIVGVAHAAHQCGWHRGRSSAFAEMAQELERAAREGADLREAAGTSLARAQGPSSHRPR